MCCVQGESRARLRCGQEVGLAPVKKRLEEAAAVKATMLATRNKNKFKILVEVGQLATEAARCRNHTLGKELRKKPGKAEEKLMPGWELFQEVRSYIDLLY